MWFWSFSHSYLYITLSAPFFFNSVFVLDAVMKFTPITVLKMSVWQLVWALEKQFLWVPWSDARTSRSLKPELSQYSTSALTLQYWAKGDSPFADRYSLYVAVILRLLSATWIICLPRVLAAAAISSCQGIKALVFGSAMAFILSSANQYPELCMLCCESIGYTRSVVDVWTDRWSGGPCGWRSSYAECQADFF